MKKFANALLIALGVFGSACAVDNQDCDPDHHDEACDHDHDHHDHGEMPGEYVGLTNPYAQNPLATAHGEQLFVANCADCHGPRGRGNGPQQPDMGPPPANLVSLVRDAEITDGYLYWRIAEGGVEQGTAMPAWQDTLGEHGIWNVITYLQCMVASPPCVLHERRVNRGAQR